VTRAVPEKANEARANRRFLCGLLTIRNAEGLRFFIGAAMHHKARLAIVRPTSERELSAFVAFSPKNGLHRASMRLPGSPGVGRVEGQFQ
jgi:hypothetical protein